MTCCLTCNKVSEAFAPQPEVPNLAAYELSHAPFLSSHSSSFTRLKALAPLGPFAKILPAVCNASAVLARWRNGSLKRCRLQENHYAAAIVAGNTKAYKTREEQLCHHIFRSERVSSASKQTTKLSLNTTDYCQLSLGPSDPRLQKRGRHKEISRNLAVTTGHATLPNAKAELQLM